MYVFWLFESVPLGDLFFSVPRVHQINRLVEVRGVCLKRICRGKTTNGSSGYVPGAAYCRCASFQPFQKTAYPCRLSQNASDNTNGLARLSCRIKPLCSNAVSVKCNADLPAPVSANNDVNVRGCSAINVKTWTANCLRLVENEKHRSTKSKSVNCPVWMRGPSDKSTRR